MRFLSAFVLGVLLLPATSLADERRAARDVFGAFRAGNSGAPEVIGGYARGCLSGGVELPADGPNWQAMRPSRNRAWGHPSLVDFVIELSEIAAREDGWPGLLVGDMTQPRGGPMLSGHASHQSGLDVDIWLTPMPQRRLSVTERNEMSATLVVENGPFEVKRHVWTEGHFNVIRRAASHPKVDRVLVAPGIKKALCEAATGDRSWLRTVRPYWGHNFHMHVRLKCPEGSPNCEPQAAPPEGDGCGEHLAWWFTDEPWKPRQPRADDPPPRTFPLTLAELPAQCRALAIEPTGISAPLPPRKGLN